jgi:hypothetical protein
MADVFSNTPPDDDEDETPGIRVAGALTGDGEDDPPQEAPQAEQPQGMVDGAAQSYLTPAAADDDEGGAPQAAGGDEPVSADTAAYMKPVAPPMLAKPAAYVDHSSDQGLMPAQKAQEVTENTKPSILRRIGAGLAAGAVGFGTRNAGEGMNVGREITGEPLAEAQHRWAMEEAPIQAKINADQAQDAATARANAVTEAQNKLAETNYSNQIRGQQDAARAENYQAQAEARRNAITSFTPDDPANPYAGGTGRTGDGRTVKGIPPPDKWLANWEKNPDNVASAEAQKGIKTVKALQAAGVKLTPEQIAIVASGGKVTPAVHTNINIAENPDGSARTPAGAAGQAGPGEIIAKSMQDKQEWLDSLTQEKEDRVVDGVPIKAGTYDKNGNPISQQQINDRLEKFRTDLNANPVMRKSGTMVNEKGETVTNRFSRNPQTAASAPPAPSGSASPPSAASPTPTYKAKSGATVTVGTRVVVNGRQGVVDGFDDKGKPHVKY